MTALRTLDHLGVGKAKQRPNMGMEPTPLRVDKIGAILKAGIGSTVFPLYWGSAAEAQGVGPPLSCTR